MNLRINTVLVGTPKPLARGKESAIAKRAVIGAVMIRANGLEGDAQADLRVHGGPDKAVHLYPFAHYQSWCEELTSPQAVELLKTPGAFGENLSVDRLTEHDVCIGDIWQAGNALLQISQGRQPCWKLNERFGVADMAARVQNSGRTGWYFRVLQPGSVESGAYFQLRERPNPNWSIAKIADIFYRDRMNFEALREISLLAELAEGWKNLVLKRLSTQQVEDWSRRLGS